MRFVDERTLPAGCERVHAMLADIERYPEFLPGWEEARILARTHDRLQVIQTVRAGPVPLRFHTEARLTPQHLRIRGCDGPFRRLTIDWWLEARGAEGCRVRLEVELDVRAGPLARLLEGRFRQQARGLLAHFARRLAALDAAPPG